LVPNIPTAKKKNCSRYIEVPTYLMHSTLMKLLLGKPLTVLVLHSQTILHTAVTKTDNICKWICTSKSSLFRCWLMQNYKHFCIMMEVLLPFYTAVLYQMLKMENTFNSWFYCLLYVDNFMYTTPAWIPQTWCHVITVVKNMQATLTLTKAIWNLVI
jgi:hypothetical protein